MSAICLGLACWSAPQAAFCQGASGACEFAQLATSNAITGESFGWSVTLSGQRLVVTAPRKKVGIYVPGVAYVYERCGPNWFLDQTLSPTTASIAFGQDSDLEGDTLVVGTQFDSTAASLAGSAYVFEYDGTQFVQTAYLLPSVPSSSMNYGSSLDLDQDRIAIGADADSTISGNQGSVYLYDKVGGVWSETQLLRPAASAIQVGFGNTVSLKGDELFVGARIANSSEGEVFYYTFDGSQWSLQQCIQPSDPSVSEDWGIVSFDGETLVVGAPESLGPFGINSGLVSILEQDGAGQWVEVQVILPPFSSTPSLFGQAVSVEGDWLAVGAGFDSSAAILAGAIHLYNKVGCTWTFAGTLTHQGAKSSDGLAAGSTNSGVALDGDIVAGGAILGDSSVMDSGTAHTWSISGATCKTLSASPTSLSLSAGGIQQIRLAAGAPFAQSLYWIVGTLSGTDPGFFFANGRLPINIDCYFLLTLVPGPQNPLLSSTGLLSNSGSATASLVIAPGTDPSLIGLRIDHAAVAFSLNPLSLDHISNPVDLVLEQ